MTKDLISKIAILSALLTGSAHAQGNTFPPGLVGIGTPKTYGGQSGIDTTQSGIDTTQSGIDSFAEKPRALKKPQVRIYPPQLRSPSDYGRVPPHGDAD